MAESAFGGVIQFMYRLGVYDVILPFLLIFTIMFAILEKTRVFGTEKWGDQQVPKKNLNAMVAFVVGFLVVASTEIVEIFNKALPRVMLLLIVVVLYLMLIGTFYSEKEEVVLTGKWKHFFMILMFIGVVLIFAGSIEASSGVSWLEWFFDYLASHWDSTTVSSIVLVIIVVGIIVWVTNSDGPKEKKDAGSS